MKMVDVGIEFEKSFIVEDAHLAKNVGSGSVSVLGTPMMIAFIENTAAESIKKYLEEDDTTVGSHLDVTHEAPTPVGMKVTIKIKVSSVKNEKIINFDVEAYDEAGLIGKGTHTRVLVNKIRFEEKANSKKV